MSQVNHNYSYVFEIDGHTVWERLRNIRNFKSDREKALALAELSMEEFAVKMKRKEKRLEELKAALKEAEQSDALQSVLTSAQEAVEDMVFEIRKANIEMMGHDELTQDCRDELEFIRLFEARLVVEAEKTRIPGRTDREMYEINFPQEARTRDFTRAVLEATTTGSLGQETLNKIRRDPTFAQEIVKSGLLTDQQCSIFTTSVPESVHAVNKLIAPLPATMILQLENQPEETSTDTTQD